MLSYLPSLCSSRFSFNDTATTEIYTLSLHDALPILPLAALCGSCMRLTADDHLAGIRGQPIEVVREQTVALRSEEHTSELQSQSNLVCRLLLEKKNKKTNQDVHTRLRFHH